VLATTGSRFRETLKRFVTGSTSSAGTLVTESTTGSAEAGSGAGSMVGLHAGSIERSCVIFGSLSIVLDIWVCPSGLRT
jgi:hypothetical protein